MWRAIITMDTRHKICRVQLEISLIDDGLDGFVIDAMLDHHHDRFVAWRRLIMPSTAEH